MARHDCASPAAIVCRAGARTPPSSLVWFEGARRTRARLSGLLWPAAAEERARGNLRRRLSKLRQEAGDLVRDERGVLSLAPTIAIDAAESPRAGLLASFEYDDSENFARWLDGRRESEREQRKRQWLAEVRTAAQSMRLDDALSRPMSFLKPIASPKRLIAC